MLGKGRFHSRVILNQLCMLSIEREPLPMLSPVMRFQHVILHLRPKPVGSPQVNNETITAENSSSDTENRRHNQMHLPKLRCQPSLSQALIRLLVSCMSCMWMTCRPQTRYSGQFCAYSIVPQLERNHTRILFSKMSADSAYLRRIQRDACL